jgi:hypothetical protein
MAKVHIWADGLEDTGIKVPSLLLAFPQSRKPLILPTTINGKTPEFYYRGATGGYSKMASDDITPSTLVNSKH